MKLVRALSKIYVPANPEKPKKSGFVAVQKGLLAIVPDDHRLPKNSFEEIKSLDDLGKEKKKRGRKKKETLDQKEKPLDLETQEEIQTEEI